MAKPKKLDGLYCIGIRKVPTCQIEACECEGKDDDEHTDECIDNATDECSQEEEPDHWVSVRLSDDVLKVLRAARRQCTRPTTVKKMDEIIALGEKDG